jgi:HPt (histidine-containing phosphotransfer) domain-containing protein
MVDGITEDYVWYHAKLLQEKMNHWDLDFQKLVKVMESRHNEHLRMLDRALEENRILKRQLKEKKK